MAVIDNLTAGNTTGRIVELDNGHFVRGFLYGAERHIIKKSTDGTTWNAVLTLGTTKGVRHIWLMSNGYLFATVMDISDGSA